MTRLEFHFLLKRFSFRVMSTPDYSSLKFLNCGIGFSVDKRTFLFSSSYRLNKVSLFHYPFIYLGVLTLPFRLYVSLYG